MSAASSLVQKMRARRERWVEVAPGKEVKVRRPSETDRARFGEGGDLRNDYDLARTFAVDWRGVTEADLLGPEIGASDPVPFDAEVWAEAAGDRLAWVRVVAAAVVADLNAHRLSIEEASGN